MKSNSNLITLKDIKKSYFVNNEEHIILNNLNLSIEQGEFLMIMGKSGSGKTSLLNILGFLNKFNEGQYIFKGEDVTFIKESDRAKFRNENIGFVFQQFNLINTLTIYQNMELPLIYKGVTSKEERETIIKEKLEIVGLLDKIKQRPNQLSGGQQQRIAIARALVNDADIIFADEPTGALDAETCVDIMNLLKDLNKQGKTILMVTHDSDLISYATRVVKLKNGVFETENENNSNKDNASNENKDNASNENVDLNNEQELEKGNSSVNIEVFKEESDKQGNTCENSETIKNEDVIKNNNSDKEIEVEKESEVVKNEEVNENNNSKSDKNKTSKKSKKGKNKNTSKKKKSGGDK